MMLSSFRPRLILMLSSLRLRIILMFMLVVMVAVGTVVLIASQATALNLQVYNQGMNDQTMNNQHIVSTLLTAYQQHESQLALQALTEQLAHSSHQRIILLDHQRRVIADLGHTLNGQVIPETMLTGASFSTSPASSSVDTSSSLSSSLYISTDLPTQPGLLDIHQ